VWWVSRHPALAVLAATALLSPVGFPPATLNAQVTTAPESTSAQTLVLNPQRIVITLSNDFQAPRAPTSFDRAVKNIGDQIDARREAELDKATTVGALWRARFWNYLPRSAHASLNSPVSDGDDDDPFIVPFYLLPENRILDRKLAESDVLARHLFGRAEVGNRPTKP
jgi:hypothetical protein